MSAKPARYTFEFKYDWFNCSPHQLEGAHPLGRRKEDKSVPVRVTYVTIYKDGVNNMEGQTTQHPHDQDIKETARKTAIKNALSTRAGWLSKKTRTAIWTAYFGRSKKLRI